MLRPNLVLLWGQRAREPGSPSNIRDSCPTLVSDYVTAETNLTCGISATVNQRGIAVPERRWRPIATALQHHKSADWRSNQVAPAVSGPCTDNGNFGFATRTPLARCGK